MFTKPHLTGKRLADLCHRLAISTESGIDIRRTWEREAQAASGGVGKAFALVHQGVASGDSLSVSLARTGGLFPRLFLEMVDVGEQTGTLSEVLHRLSDHYQRQHEMTRDFRRRLAWPMLQLGGAAVIIGILLGVLGALGAQRLNGEPIDVLGLGVTGMDALALYIEILVGLALGFFVLLHLIRRGGLWLRPVQHLVMAIPGIGPALEKLCLARLTWALQLMLNVEMDLRRLVPLALRSTGSDYYTSHSKEITAAVAAGSPLHGAFASAGVFPPHFLDALYVAEESGQMVESMTRLSKQYEQEADSAIETLSTILSFAIWGGVMLLVAVLVVRLFKVLYVDMITDALNF